MGSVQRRESEQVGVSLSRRHPPVEDHAARAGHGQSIAVPRGLRRVTRHCAVRTVLVARTLQARPAGSSRLTFMRSYALYPGSRTGAAFTFHDDADTKM